MNLNFAHTLSNTSTIRANIKQTVMCALSENTVLIKNVTQINTKSSVKIEPIQFAQL